jgi:hypothetical protein
MCVTPYSAPAHTASMTRYPPELREAAVKAVVASRRGAASQTTSTAVWVISSTSTPAPCAAGSRGRTAASRRGPRCDQPKREFLAPPVARGVRVIAGLLVAAVVAVFGLFQSQDFKDATCPENRCRPVPRGGMRSPLRPGRRRRGGAVPWWTTTQGRQRATRRRLGMLSSEYKAASSPGGKARVRG